MANLKGVLKLLEDGQFEKARDLLENHLQQNPEDINLLYNLGMCYTELNQPTKAIELLNKCIQLAPNYSNAHVALGFAYLKLDDLQKAKEYFLKAIEIDPVNSYALKNLGGLWGKLGNNFKALFYLKRSFEANPNDPHTAYGLGITYLELGDLENADKYLKRTLEMKPSSQIESLVKDELRGIAVKKLKSKGFRVDAVFYLLGALNLFKSKPFEEIKNIAFEIGLKGRTGLDINDPQKKYQINSLHGTFTGLQLVCYMYVGFKRVAPEMDIGIDLSDEYKTALKLFDTWDEKWLLN